MKWMVKITWAQQRSKPEKKLLTQHFKMTNFYSVSFFPCWWRSLNDKTFGRRFHSNFWEFMRPSLPTSQVTPGNYAPRKAIRDVAELNVWGSSVSSSLKSLYWDEIYSQRQSPQPSAGIVYIRKLVSETKTKKKHTQPLCLQIPLK